MKTTKATRGSNPVPADILMTLPDLGVDVDKIKGDEAWALCPGPHAARVGAPDRHASWSINLDTGMHSCFSCGWGGPYILLVKFAMDWQKDNDKAEEWVRKHGGIDVAIKKLHGVTAYEKKRAVEVTEVDLFPFTTPPDYALEERDLDRESVEAYGVLWMPEEKHWILPVREPYTNRLLGWQEKGDDFFMNYPPNVEKSKTLFGFDILLSLPHPRTAYLEESPLDPVRLHTYGVDGAVSSYGVHVSEAQMNLLVDEVDILVLCLDNDGPGRSKTREIMAEYRGQFRGLYTANYKGIREKDHGDMGTDDIEWSLTNRISSVRFRA